MQPKGNYCLAVRQGPKPGHTYPLDRRIITIGRDARSDVVVSDPEVSRSHARLTAQAGGYLVEDLGSTNGTYLNGQRLTAPRRLQPGDRLGLGEMVLFELEFVAESAPAPRAAGEPAGASPVPPPAGTGPRTAPLTPGAQSSPTSAPSQPVGAPPRGGGGWRWAALGCGCLAVVICLAAVIALAVFLWTAPVDFWRELYRFFGLY